MAIAVRCGGRKAPLVPQDDVDNTDRAGNHGRSRAAGIGSRNIIGCDLAVAHRVRNRVDSGLRNRHGRGVSRHRPRVGLRASRAGANIDQKPISRRCGKLHAPGNGTGRSWFWPDHVGAVGFAIRLNLTLQWPTI